MTENIRVIKSDLDGSSETVIFEHVEPMEVIRWFALNRPYPEKNTGQIGGSIIKVTLANNHTLLGEGISKWIHDLSCPVCKS